MYFPTLPKRLNAKLLISVTTTLFAQAFLNSAILLVVLATDSRPYEVLALATFKAGTKFAFLFDFEMDGV